MYTKLYVTLDEVCFWCYFSCNFKYFIHYWHMQAYHRGMIYPNYLYISYYQNSEYWWTDPIRNVSAYPAPQCTALQLTFAIFRSFAIDYFPVPSSAEENATTDVGYVSIIIKNNYITWLKVNNYTHVRAC